eukprot:TRINITY_DN14417_c0_g1_i1.p1 TRINITY_DN14417_c0_g1~~TRINITY_DN14417_c0_g1_i1.p1  ORF type:complete len:373 (+),score=60.54 TRINITY_DN14417_c0_g1_i1:51-1169(+)
MTVDVFITLKTSQSKFDFIFPDCISSSVLESLKYLQRSGESNSPSHFDECINEMFGLKNVRWKPPDLDKFCDTISSGPVLEFSLDMLDQVVDKLKRVKEVKNVEEDVRLNKENFLDTEEEILDENNSDAREKLTDNHEKSTDNYNNSDIDDLFDSDNGNLLNELPDENENCDVFDDIFDDNVIADGLLSPNLAEHNELEEVKSPPKYLKESENVTQNKVKKRREVLEKRFTCNYCSRPFKLKHQLQSHLDIHLQVKKFSCDVCGKVFRQMNHLKKHVEELHVFKTSGQTFMCSQCGKGFPSARKLKYHIESTHEGRYKKPVNCHYCGKSFSRAKLKGHIMKEHEKNFAFYCDVCNKGFVNQYYLRRHVNQVH